MRTSSRPDIRNKIFRIGLHVVCLFVHPLAHSGFHFAGIIRELRFL